MTRKKEKIYFTDTKKLKIRFFDETSVHKTRINKNDLRELFGMRIEIFIVKFNNKVLIKRIQGHSRSKI